MSTSDANAMSVDPLPTKWTISPEEEDSLAQKRERDNDERQLRKISRKLHQLSNARKDALARASASAADPALAISESERVAEDKRAVDDAKENALVELDSFLLFLEKLEMVRLAEMRQSDEYERMHQTLLQEHDESRTAITQLKLDLQEAEQQRERKKEYDVIAERINTLPPRSELNSEISELESEIATIYAEQEAARELLLTKRTMMEDIRQRIREMMLHGKDDNDGGLGLVEGDGEGTVTGDGHASATATPSQRATPLPSQSQPTDTQQSQSTVVSASRPPGSRSVSSTHLNPFASEFRPSASPAPQPHAQLPSISTNHASSSLAQTNGTRSRRREEPEDGEDVEDVEMGEVSEGEGDGEGDVTISVETVNPVPQIRVTNPTNAHLQLRDDQSANASSARSSPNPPTWMSHTSRLSSLLVRRDELEEGEEGEASDRDVANAQNHTGGGGTLAPDDDVSSELTSLSDL